MWYAHSHLEFSDVGWFMTPCPSCRLFQSCQLHSWLLWDPWEEQCSNQHNAKTKMQSKIWNSYDNYMYRHQVQATIMIYKHSAGITTSQAIWTTKQGRKVSIDLIEHNNLSMCWHNNGGTVCHITSNQTVSSKQPQQLWDPKTWMAWQAGRQQVCTQQSAVIKHAHAIRHVINQQNTWLWAVPTCELCSLGWASCPMPF
jgi:hypothetical protein